VLGSRVKCSYVMGAFWGTVPVVVVLQDYFVAWLFVHFIHGPHHTCSLHGPCMATFFPAKIFRDKPHALNFVYRAPTETILKVL
jgi:hypothetical protein